MRLYLENNKKIFANKSTYIITLVIANFLFPKCGIVFLQIVCICLSENFVISWPMNVVCFEQTRFNES